MMRTDYINAAKGKAGEEVQVAGWVHEVRDLGKLIFIQLRDKTGILQVIAKKGVVPDEVMGGMKRNKEDVISVRGKVAENKVAPGGVELVPSEVQVLSVVERKLPIDPTGVVESDLDTRLNFRYLDLRKPEVAAIFRVKARIIEEFRRKTVEMGFQEVHPTHIVAAATEGGTEVFPVEYFEQKAFLAQSPQLYKQLAVIGGIDKVMITSPVWRAEKHHTTTHLNEVIQMDVEMGFADDNDAMDVLSEVTLSILKKVAEMKEELELIKAEVKVPDKVPRYTYAQIVDRLNSEGENLKWGDDFSKEQERRIYEVLGEELTIIHDWPTESRAFYSMPREDKPEVCKAYDLLYRGLEISSGAQRIHVPELLEEQLRKRDLDPKNFEFYIDAFRVGAPPHAGWSIGLERITMKATGMHNIRECMMFPRDRTRVHP
jgi:nondiscriminating aspartyl-tRNA synthetase